MQVLVDPESGVLVEPAVGVRLLVGAPEDCECCEDCFVQAQPCPGQDEPGPGHCWPCADITVPIFYRDPTTGICWYVDPTFPHLTDCDGPVLSQFAALESCEDCEEIPPCVRLLLPCDCPDLPPPGVIWCVPCEGEGLRYWKTIPPLSPFCWIDDPGSPQLQGCPPGSIAVIPDLDPHFIAQESCEACCPEEVALCDQCNECPSTICLMVHVTFDDQSTFQYCAPPDTFAPSEATVFIQLERVIQGPPDNMECTWTGSQLCPQQHYDCLGASCCPAAAEATVTCVVADCPAGGPIVARWGLEWTLQLNCCLGGIEFHCFGGELNPTAGGVKCSGSCPMGTYETVTDGLGGFLTATAIIFSGVCPADCDGAPLCE